MRLYYCRVKGQQVTEWLSWSPYLEKRPRRNSFRVSHQTCRQRTLGLAIEDDCGVVRPNKMADWIQDLNREEMFWLKFELRLTVLNFDHVEILMHIPKFSLLIYPSLIYWIQLIPLEHSCRQKLNFIFPLHMWYLMIFLVREGRWVWKVKSIEIKIESIFPVIGVSFLFSLCFYYYYFRFLDASSFLSASDGAIVTVTK